MVVNVVPSAVSLQSGLNIWVFIGRVESQEKGERHFVEWKAAKFGPLTVWKWYDSPFVGDKNGDVAAIMFPIAGIS